MKRRKLLGWFWGGLSALFAAEMAWIVGSFLRPRSPQVRDASSVFAAGPVEQFEPGTVTAFPGGKFYLVRLEDGGFMAFSRTCTHLGCTVPWNGETSQFECPCHASVFDMRGVVVSPPAPRPLDLFPVRIENGMVKVDTAESIRRETFEPSQPTRI
jgi:cytochrome b6-f complex iron-sulfur subunit